MYTKESNNLTFKVRRQKPELITPAEPTPHEFKTISDIDNRPGLQMQVPLIYIYRKEHTMGTKDPVNVIRDAIKKTLVYYYPLAGRLREGYHAQKLVVECNSEGIIFTEADADVTLEEFGNDLYPPFPCVDELVYDVPGSAQMLNSPLLLIQVTRLKCGGFIFGIRFNHIMIDGVGIVQLMSSISEIARGAKAMSVQPVWERHLLDAQAPPSVTSTHHDYDVLPYMKGNSIPLDIIVYHSLVFSKIDISTLRRNLSPRLQSCSPFEILTACLWRCRTIAVSSNLEEQAIITYAIDVRKRFNPTLPKGYYGNAVVFPIAICKSKDLCHKTFDHAVDLVRKMKLSVTNDYIKSFVNQTTISKPPVHNGIQSYIVSDLTQVALPAADFGWRKQLYSGPAKGGVGRNPCGISWYIPFKNMGENEIVVPFCLPEDAMVVFMKELKSILKMDDSSNVTRMSAM